jgi:hypothetical protein
VTTASVLATSPLATNPLAAGALIVVAIGGIALVGTARFLVRRSAAQAREGEPTPPPDDLEPGES